MCSSDLLGVATLAVAAGEYAAAADPALVRDRVARLVALAERVGARADLPVMRAELILGHFAEDGWDIGADAVDVSSLTRDEAAARAIEMIAEPPAG